LRAVRTSGSEVPKSRASHRSPTASRALAPCVGGQALEQQRLARIGHRTAVAQHRGKSLGVAETEVDALPGQRMDAMRRVADERDTMRDRRRQRRELQRKPAAA
jgi:hypothetical protein